MASRILVIVFVLIGFTSFGQEPKTVETKPVTTKSELKNQPKPKARPVQPVQPQKVNAEGKIVLTTTNPGPAPIVLSSSDSGSNTSTEGMTVQKCDDEIAMIQLKLKNLNSNPIEKAKAEEMGMFVTLNARLAELEKIKAELIKQNGGK